MAFKFVYTIIAVEDISYLWYGDLPFCTISLIIQVVTIFFIHMLWNNIFVLGH